MIPVEHLVINPIDRLGEYLLVYVPFLQFDDCKTVVELDENEKELLAILLSNREFMETLNNLEYCTLFIWRKSVDKDVEQNIFDVERACDFLSISQYRYDKKEWSMGKPGAIGPYLIMFDVNIMTGRIEVSYKEKHLFNEIPGIGLEVSYAPLSRDENFYPIIFMNRNDEVYMTCRYYITKAWVILLFVNHCMICQCVIYFAHGKPESRVAYPLLSEGLTLQTKERRGC